MYTSTTEKIQVLWNPESVVVVKPGFIAASASWKFEASCMGSKRDV